MEANAARRSCRSFICPWSIRKSCSTRSGWEASMVAPTCGSLATLLRPPRPKSSKKMLNSAGDRSAARERSSDFKKVVFPLPAAPKIASGSLVISIESTCCSASKGLSIMPNSAFSGSGVCQSQASHKDLFFWFLIHASTSGLMSRVLALEPRTRLIYSASMRSLSGRISGSGSGQGLR